MMSRPVMSESARDRHVMLSSSALAPPYSSCLSLMYMAFQFEDYVYPCTCGCIVLAVIQPRALDSKRVRCNFVPAFFFTCAHGTRYAAPQYGNSKTSGAGNTVN